MRSATRFILATWFVVSGFVTANATSEFLQPWKNKKNAIVIDAYEFNPIDWAEMLKDKRIAAFISKSSDGLPPKYGCTGDEKSFEFRYCRVAWRKYSVTKELYHSRRHIAKSAGLKWGAYHLARAGNPVAQADHFIEFARPTDDEMIVLDIEDVNNKEYMSLEDAEIFAKRIKERLGRYPILYANNISLEWVSLKREKLPVLSRMNIWYARYKDDIRGVFPLGNWYRYLIWQFAYGGNCTKKSCPYRVPGTERNIDVNVMNMSVDELKKGWPFDGLVPERVINKDIAYKKDREEFYKLAESKVLQDDKIIPDAFLTCLTEGEKLKRVEECAVALRN